MDTKCKLDKEDKIHNNIEIVIKVINEAYFYNKTIKTNKML